MAFFSNPTAFSRSWIVWALALCQWGSDWTNKSGSVQSIFLLFFDRSTCKRNQRDEASTTTHRTSINSTAIYRCSVQIQVFLLAFYTSRFLSFCNNNPCRSYKCRSLNTEFILLNPVQMCDIFYGSKGAVEEEPLMFLLRPDWKPKGTTERKWGVYEWIPLIIDGNQWYFHRILR